MISATSLPTICILFCVYQTPSPVVVDSFAQQCTIIRPSRTDTDATLQQIAKANARCRAARERAKSK